VTGQRKALIVASDEYEHEGLRHLLAPAADAEALDRVLSDPRIGDFAVQVVHNEPAHLVQAQIEDVLSESNPEDVLLLHFSCHGLKSDSGELFFAARNTRPDRLGSTAISAAFVQRCMRASRSRSIVLLLDCCYGAAFAQGVTVRAGGDVNVMDAFPGGKLGGGRGRAVITASSAMEYAFEGDRVGAEYCVTSCDLGVFVDQAAEAVAPQNPDTCASYGRILASGGRVLVQRPVRPVGVVVIGALAEDQLEVPFAGDQHPVEDLAAHGACPAFHDRVAPHHQLHRIRSIGTDVSG
jgi:hypothetical protein